MTGFTLYETLRIFVPGLLGLVLLDLVLRFAYGDSPVAADGGVRALASAIESPLGGIAGSLAIGLVLYLTDLSAKARIQAEGDPDHNFRLPSQRLEELMEGSDLADKGLALYFIISDKYLPPELHRRVYLFGSLFRIYVDFRAMLAVSVVAGVVAALLSVSSVPGFDPTPPVSLDMTLFIGSALVLLVAIGSVGVRKYKSSVVDAHGPEEYRNRFWREVRGVGRLAACLIWLGFVSGELIVLTRGVPRLIGVVLGALSMILWTWLEMGPPTEHVNPPQQEPFISWRSRVLNWLARRKGYVQYSPVQRLVADVSLFAPWFVFASVAHVGRESQAASIVAWVLLAVLATTIMSLRKHEERLLAAYEDQSLWLDLHEGELKKIKETRALPDQWI
jgi:hypothetical protein